MTYDALLALPPHVVGEIIDGELHVSPRPRLRHAQVLGMVREILGPPFRAGVGGPGGWLLLPEPELHLGPDVIVPDLAGWRRERAPSLSLDDAFATLAPDWACEVLSPSTVRLDRGRKLAVYARERVPHVWLLDPGPRTLEILHLEGATYRTLTLPLATQATAVRAAPFDAIPLDLAPLWSP